MGRDDTTDKLFPHQMRGESGIVERPVPMQRSIRAEFAEHRLLIEEQIRAFDNRLGEALARLSPVPTVGSALRRGTVLATRGTAIAAAVLGVLELTVPLVKPEWMGPLKALREFLGAPQ